MPLYKVLPCRLAEVPNISLAAAGLKERKDIQRLLREQIDVLDPGLLVIAEEFCEWSEGSRRIDLLCVDRDAKLVVVELKRDDSGYMDLQALRYAAMVSTMTFDAAVETLAKHSGSGTPDPEAARSELLEFFGWTSPDGQRFPEDVRVILVASEFDKELTTSVLWLRERGIDVRCMRLRPYRLEDGGILMECTQLIPLPEAADYQVRVEQQKAAERKERIELTFEEQTRVDFYRSLKERAAKRTALHRDSPVGPKASWLSCKAGGRNFIFYSYVVKAAQVRVELSFWTKKDLYRLVLPARETIERAFGEPLTWKESLKSGTVEIARDGVGFASAREMWPEIQDWMIERMIRLERAFRDHIAALPGGERRAADAAAASREVEPGSPGA
jgi:hypothetical protein